MPAVRRIGSALFVDMTSEGKQHSKGLMGSLLLVLCMHCCGCKAVLFRGAIPQGETVPS